MQERLKKFMGFSLPFVVGRGIFNYDSGFLPMRKPIVSVGTARDSGDAPFTADGRGPRTCKSVGE